MNNKGYIAFSTILIVSVVVLAIAVTSSLVSLGEAQSSFAQYNGESTLQFVEGCAEDALLKVRANAAYAGGSITRPEGTCTITITGAGNPKTLTATTTNTSYKRTVQIVYNRTGTGVTLVSWREIP